MKTLAARCNYGEIVDSLVRDRIVCVIIDSQERLLRTPELTLDKCIDISRAAEITQQGISVLDSNPSAGNHAEYVKKISNDKPNAFKILCKFCGKSHEREKEKNVQRTARDVTFVMEQTILKQYATTFLRSFHSGSIGRKQCITLKHQTCQTVMEIQIMRFVL